MEMNEVSLAVGTPKGLVVVVGCSHPGVEKILEGRTRRPCALHQRAWIRRIARTIQEAVRIGQVWVLSSPCRNAAHNTLKKYEVNRKDSRVATTVANPCSLHSITDTVMPMLSFGTVNGVQTSRGRLGTGLMGLVPTDVVGIAGAGD
jgi:hypothetical protein